MWSPGEKELLVAVECFVDLSLTLFLCEEQSPLQ